MSDTYLTQTELESTFQSLISSILNTTDPSVVRIGWPQDGQPAWGISDDVVFLLVNYDDNPYARQMQLEYQTIDANTANQSQTSIQPIRLNMDIYGPNSFDNASLIRSNLMLPSTWDTLSQSNLAVIPDIPMPIRAPEMFNGQWWSHVSLYAQFYELVVRNQTIYYLQTADVTPEFED